MRALLYACVTGADLGQTVNDEKLPELRRYAGVQGWEVAQEFTDAIPTGIGKRPGFESLCAALKAGSGNVIVANSIADLCWNLAEGFQRLRQLGLGTSVSLVCIRNSFDATTPTGANRLLDALELVAEHGRDRTRDRQRIGILRAQAKAGGMSISGRPRRVINFLEIKGLWERAYSQREILKQFDRIDCHISKGTLSSIIRDAKAAGMLDSAAREAAGSKRGGVPKGGRPRKPAKAKRATAA